MKQQQKTSRTKRPPVRLKSRRVQLVPHAHSLRLMHHRHTSYPMLAFILLLTGVILVSWTHLAAAVSYSAPSPMSDSYVVNATVVGTAPTVAATIDDPASGTQFSDKPITVRGSCPRDTYIQLFRNNVPSGVTVCGTDGRYDVQTDLFNGKNQIVAHVYNFAGTEGPASNAITVFYTPPASKPGASTSTPSSSPATSGPAMTEPVVPLTLKNDFQYQGFYVDEIVHWQLDVQGGTAPYAISIDWGDGTSELLSRPRSGLIDVQHTYTKAGGEYGSYIVIAKATDALGNSSTLQSIMIINDPPTSASTTNRREGAGFRGLLPDTGGAFELITKYVWPAYGIAAIMTFSFFLGERHELGQITRSRQQRPPRMHRT